MSFSKRDYVKISFGEKIILEKLAVLWNSRI